MYETCPSCGYRRRPEDTAPTTECPSCGVVFRKWLRHHLRQGEPPGVPRARPRSEPYWPRLGELLLPAPARADALGFWARVVVYLGLFVWGWSFVLMDHTVLLGGLPEINGSFMHLVNLVFHEAGHVIFMLLGRFMSVLGGSLGQLIMPAVVTGVLLLQTRDAFGASVGLWWFAQSAMDLAPYVHDARAGQMILLGGVTGRDRPGYHDWENILGTLGWLHHDHRIASMVDGLGVFLMMVALVWGAAALYVNYRALPAGR